MTAKSLNQIVYRSAAKNLHRRALAWLFAATAASAGFYQCELTCAQEVYYGTSPGTPVIMQGVGPQNNYWTNAPVQKSTLPTSPWQEAPRQKPAPSGFQNGTANPAAPVGSRVIRQPSRRAELPAPSSSSLKQNTVQPNNAPPNVSQPFSEQPPLEIRATEETLPAPSQSEELIDFGPVAKNGKAISSRSVASTQSPLSPLEKEWQGLPPTGLALTSDSGQATQETVTTTTPVGLKILPPQSALSKPNALNLGSMNLSNEHQTAPNKQREQLAEQISREILVNSGAPNAESPKPLESPPGWQSVETELRYRLRRCDDMLRRGATRSGRQEAVAAIRLLLRSLDLRRGDWISEPAFDAAMTALKEERDFYQPISSVGQSPSTTAIVEGHQTPILKNTSLEGVSPELASQYYRAYARDRLTVAADQHEWAADVYYALGKTFEKQATEDPSQSVLLRGQSVVCYQAALSVTPTHPDAATQLSFVLLQLDRSSEAEEVIAASLQIRNSPNDWRNLVEVYRRQGNPQGQQWASQQLAIAEQTNGPNFNSLPRIQQISPEQFVQISPYVDMIQTAQAPIAGPAAAVGSAPGTNPTQANIPATQSLGWASKIFR